MASATPLPDLDAVLRAPDLTSAEQALMALLPDRPHLDALLDGSDAGQRQALAMALAGLRIQEFCDNARRRTPQRRADLDSVRQVFAAR